MTFLYPKEDTYDRQPLPTRPETASIRAEQAKLAFPDVLSSFQRPLKGPAFGYLDPPLTEPNSPIPPDFPLTQDPAMAATVTVPEGYA